MPTDLSSSEKPHMPDFFADTSVNRAGVEITLGAYLLSAVCAYGPDAARAFARWYEQGGTNAMAEYFRMLQF